MMTALKRGDQINVRYGAKGMQEALVLSTACLPEAVRVTKFRANSGRWTRPRWIPASEILGYARSPAPDDLVREIEALANAPRRRVN